MDRVDYWRGWMCRKCGQKFRPEVRQADLRKPEVAGKTQNGERVNAIQFSQSEQKTPDLNSGAREVSRSNSVEQILEALQASRVRATYGAVAGVLGVPAVAVGRMLGEKRPLASWVVSKSTGLPSGYSAVESHSALTSNPRILETAEELSDFLGR